MKTKTFSLRQLLILTFVFINFHFALAWTAPDFIVDGIYYYKNADSVSVTVTNRGYDNYKIYKGNIIIPSTVQYNNKVYSVIAIDEYVFSGCSDIISLIIPNSVSYIGDYVFWNCRKLTDITLPNSIKSIGKNWFDGCVSLYNLDFLPDSITKICERAFNGCFRLSNIALPNSVRTIETFAFAGCTGVTSLTIPSSVDTICDSAFSGCSNLKTLFFNAERCGDFYQEAGYYSRRLEVFNNCPINNVVIGNSVKRIPRYLLNSTTDINTLYWRFCTMYW